MKHCYIHIPFCDSICSYCDFCKMINHSPWVDQYLTALEKEIKNTYQNETLETIYIGGGTPSSLTPNQLERLFQILSVLKKAKNVEFTIEGNFENTTKEKLKIYQKYGVNRLSFGIESTSKKNLDFLERELNPNKVQEILEEAIRLGIPNINVDLMYALPTESLDDLEKDIEYVLSLPIKHLSTYSLIIEDHTKLKIKNIQPISDELDSQMYERICQRLKENNFIHYEISNFSKPGQESKHNLCYWNNEEYYGFGLGASSYQNHKRITNTKTLQDYLEGFYQKEVEELDKTSTMEYELILNLRKKEGLSLSKFKEKYQEDFYQVFPCQEFIEKDFLREENYHIRIPEDKWYISNEILVQILERENHG